MLGAHALLAGLVLLAAAWRAAQGRRVRSAAVAQVTRRCRGRRLAHRRRQPIGEPTTGWEVAVSVMRFDPFGDPFRSLDRLTSQLMSGTRTPMGMPMDVWQAEDGYHIALDLPGVDPGSVEITSEPNLLTIPAERRAGYA